MRNEEAIDGRLLGELTGAAVLGIDIGSRNAKAVLLRERELHTALVPTGVDMQETARELLEELRAATGVGLEDVEQVVGTGYGRVALSFEETPTQILTEISCHAMGAHFLDADTRTIIDIGGQDAKGIQVDPSTGRVVAFKMNDKCAAGTGRFLEKAAHLLDFTVHEVGPASLRAAPLDVSSQCVVFAESEVVSLRARGEAREAIAAGVHFASARRVVALLHRIPLAAHVVFTGGVSNNVGMRRALESLLGCALATTRLDMVYAGALGAAIHAQQIAARAGARAVRGPAAPGARLEDLTRRIEDAELSIVERKDVKKVGYLCTYTPVELLEAAGVAHARLAKCGEPDVVAQGEQLTKSVFCDATKSLLGLFMAKDPLHDALDQLVAFHTCDSMRATADAVATYFKPVSGYVVPRVAARASGRALFRDQLLLMRKDLETLTGHVISDEAVREQVGLFRRLRGCVRAISELRKRNRPPLTGTEFLEVTRAHRTLPPREQEAFLSDLYRRLAAEPDDELPRLRVMVGGGMLADGDRRVMDLLEKELGAQVVVEDHCTGLSPYAHDAGESGDPWQDLAAHYLDQAPCARQSPIGARVDFATRLAREYRVDAVVFTYLKFCPCYGMTKSLFLRSFEAMGLPALELDTDYSRNDGGQLKTRLEAFVEVIRQRKGGVQA